MSEYLYTGPAWSSAYSVGLGPGGAQSKALLAMKLAE